MLGNLFRSSIPQPPLPDIEIHLSSPADKVFRPDDIVNGWIAFTPRVPIAPHALIASLWGHSQIWHRTSHTSGGSVNNNRNTNYHHWRDNAPLFEVATNILQTPNSQPSTLEVGQTYTFPFQFKFPLGTANSRSGQYRNDADERWTVGPHHLPPTFWQGSKHGIKDAPNWAKIEYGVRARLVCPGVGIAQGQNLVDFTVSAPVIFAPLSPDARALQEPPSLSRQNGTKSFILHSSTLTGQDSSSIGFRQSMRDRFSSKTPKLDFHIAMMVPEFIISGCEFRFGAAFQVLQKSVNVTHVPSVQFTVLRLDLQDITTYRAPRDTEASNTMSGSHRGNRYDNMPAPDAPFWKYEHDQVSKEEVHLNCVSPSTTIELEEVSGAEKKEMMQADSCEVWFTARVPGFTPPSFRSFAISRAYRLKVKIGVEIGGKKFEHEAKCDIHGMGSAPA